MKRHLVLVLFVVVAAAGVISPEAVFAEPENSVNFGIGGASHIMPHCRANIYSVEYERVLGPELSVLGRGSGVNYKFDDGSHVEEGKPHGIDVGLRYYPAGGMKGFFVGGALGYWEANWTFTNDKGTASESQGKGEFKAVRADVDFGVRFPIGSSPVSLLPEAHIGKFIKSASCEYSAPASRAGTPCSKDTEVGDYIFLGVLVGIGF